MISSTRISTRIILTSFFSLCGALLLCSVAIAQFHPGQSAPSQANAEGDQGSQANGQTPADNSLAEAIGLHLQVYALVNQGKYDAALPLAQRALDLRVKKLGTHHLLVAASMSQLSAVYYAKGDFARAKSLLNSALAIREELVGPNNIAVAAALNNLAVLYRDEADYARAEELLLRALSIFENISGVESSDAALAQSNLGALYMDKGDFAQAEERVRKALSIRRKLFGSEHVNVAASLNSLGLLYQAKGDYVRAEPPLQESLKIREKLEGEENPDVAVSLNNLASLYDVKGDYERAEALYLRASDIFKKVHGGDDNLNVAVMLSNLAAMYTSRADYAHAEKNLLRVLAIREKVLGTDHPEVALSHNNLGVLYQEMGDFAQAKEQFQRAEELYGKTLGHGHPDYALTLNNLASVAQGEGDYARAEGLFQQSLAIREKMLGKEHPDVAVSLNNLADLYWEKGDASHAIDFLTRANDVRERNLALLLTIGSEKQKRLYLQTLTSETYSTISLHTLAWPDKSEAARLALTTILRRKGRALDAMMDQVGNLRRHAGAQDSALLDKLSNARTQLAALVIKGPGQMEPEQHRALVDKLKAAIEDLEAQVSARSGEFQVHLSESPVTIEQVQQALPAGAALIELALYRPHNLKARIAAQRFGAERYVAYVLWREGEPRMVELGDAAAVDAAVGRFRESLRKTSNPNVKQSGRELDELVMRPLRKLFSETRTLLLSPDGALNLVPFAALVDENGRYLVENYTITYLTSGRDLLRLKVQGQSRQPPIIFANPAFDLTTQGVNAVPRQLDVAGGVHPTELDRMSWQQLPGTAEEATALKRILPGSRVLAQQQATESSLKRVSAPSILHVATHGFFLDDRRGQSGTGPPATSADERIAGIENPLLRSGLVLAGANHLQGGNGEDGVLTALEASSLDLWGTKLVVLSACETGVGDVRSGDGVYGLRRALVLAGAESELMSLWHVEDSAALQIMVEYYTRLQGGEGRTEALRQVQLWMLQRPGKRHPYYWASFIPVGDWKPLETRKTSAK